jgi:TolB-like protein
MAVALLLIGLPIMLATAVVQGGIPGLRMVDAMDPNELEGLTPEEVLVVPRAHPMYGVSLLTWRNAILGGVMVAALLATSVVAYLAMWALGIGPVGSLVAQGFVEPRDPILVAAFENRTDNARLGDDLTEAFATDLARSSIITLADPAFIEDALQRLGRTPQTRLTAALARDLAEREGIKAVVEGEVSRSGAGYRVSAGIVHPNGSSVARFHELASDDDSLVQAVEDLSSRIREKFGESLRTIRAGRVGADGI